MIPQFLLVPMMVYFVNDVSDFKTAAIQMTVIYLMSGLFDRLFIDWYWVGKNKGVDHPRNRGYDAVHLRKNADRQVGVYSYWISSFGSAHCMGGFKDLIPVL